MGYRKLKFQNRKSCGGFTLVEIMVSVAILTFMMGITLSHFGTSEKNDLLRFAARRLSESLQSAQSFAQSGTLAQYPTAQSYGVHTDLVSQQIVLYADQNTTTGIGLWDGEDADAARRKDALMKEVLGFDARKQQDVKLTAIAIKKIASDTAVELSSIDLAAIPPNARFVFWGIPKAGGGIVAFSDVENVTFTITQEKTGKTTKVILHPLSGRIDVVY